MKTNLLSLLLLFTLLNKPGFAQTQLPNVGFESWTNKTAGGSPYSDPSNWYSLNELVQFGFDATTIKTTDSHAGAFAVDLLTIKTPFTNIPGLLTLKPILDSTGDPDLNLNFIKFSDRPTQLQFWYKSYPEVGDKSAMACLLSKWNSTTKTRDTIGYASWNSDSTITKYTQAFVPFNYKSSSTPDSLFLLFSSSENGFDPIEGSELIVDDVSFSYTSGQSEINQNSSVNAYPNPCFDKLTLSSSNPLSSFEILDQTGKTCLAGQIANQNQQIDISELACGLYIIQINHLGQTQPTFIRLHKTN